MLCYSSRIATLKPENLFGSARSPSFMTTQQTASANGPLLASSPSSPLSSPPPAAGQGPGGWSCAGPPGCGLRPPLASRRPKCSAPSTKSQTSRAAGPAWRYAPRLASPGNRPWMPAEFSHTPALTFLMFFRTPADTHCRCRLRLTLLCDHRLSQYSSARPWLTPGLF